jgi:transposase-like protein
VHPTQLRNWVKAFADDPQHAFPGLGQMKPEQLEIARLKREVIRTVTPVGKPDAGNQHVRFDERGRETAFLPGVPDRSFGLVRSVRSRH